MTHDQNKKTLRQFQCRDYLWELFEQMSAEFECSVDYLINESMRQYARSRNYGVRAPGVGARTGPTPGAMPQAGPPQIPSAPPPPPARTGHPGNFGGGSPAAGYSPPGGYPPPPASPRASPPSYASAAPSYAPAPPASSYPPPPATHRPPPPAGYGSTPAPLPSTSGHASTATASGSGAAVASAPPPLPGGVAVPSGGPPALYVIFNGRKFPVEKEEFIIGRGSKTADLPIKDGNISRRHAAVIWQNGAWYMKDLGSTNGVEFQGRKVDSKRVEEGDVYQLCDYEIRFTYR